MNVDFLIDEEKQRGGSMMRIDAHQHFWQLERGDYGWITPEMEVLYKNYLPGDIRPELKKHQIDGTVLIQAASTIEETEYMLELYRKNEFVTGVVGWIELDSPNFQRDFMYLTEMEGLVGFRPILESIETQLAEENPRVMKNIEILVEEDIPIDLLLIPRLLPQVIKLLERYPTLRGVVDHAGKPYIKDHVLEPWKEQMEEIASYPNTMCKLSGLITEAGNNWKNGDIKPVVDHVIKTFGADAIMFGSDWPVCNGVGNYSEVFQALVDSLPVSMTETERENLFGRNAVRFYKSLRVER